VRTDSAAGALTGALWCGSDFAGEGTGGTFSRKFSRSLRTVACTPEKTVRSADQSAAGALPGGPEERDSAGEGTGGTLSEKFSRSVRTLHYR
jgi:hypothetical protein